MTTLTSRKERLNAISDAIETLIEKPTINRLDGDGWKVYRVGSQIRVDVENNNEEDK